MDSQNIVATVENDSGRRFNVRLVRRGDRFGLNDCLTHGDARSPIRARLAEHHDGAMIEFYDATYAGRPEFGPRGQFVSRYYLGTLAEDAGRGLDMHGGVPEWKINGTNVRDAVASCLRVLGAS